MAKTDLFAAFRTMASEIITEKQAAAGLTKAAGPTPADPGYQGGSSSHPTASADNGAQAATEGERSSENEADVEKQQGALSVDSTADATPGADKDNSMNLGMTQSMPGEDPSTEDDYKSNKDDPGTSHPATTDDGQKYGSANFKQASQRVVELGNKLLADVALGHTNAMGKAAAAKPAAAPAAKPAAAPAAKTAAAPAAPAASADTAVNILAGYDLAASLGLDKTAAVAEVESMIENSINEAHERADLFGSFYQKLAADESEADGEDHTSPGGGEEAGGSGAGDSEGAPGAGGGAPAGGGGAAPMGPPPGGDMGAGGPPPGAGGGDEAALQELVAALMELGITPEMLAQAGAGGGAPGAGGGGPGAMPPPADPTGGAGAPPMGDPMKVASLARNFMLSGKFQMKEAATKEARTMRDLMKRQILEMIRA